jgi:hypothetical protein
MSYRDSWTLNIETPAWESPIGPESWEDTQHAEALAYDREHFPNVHIHWERDSRDCDGRMGDIGIYWARQDDRFVDSESGEILTDDFWRFHFGWLASACAIDGTLRVKTDPYAQFDAEAEWSETTDEGYRSESIRLCVDDCETPRNTHYDQYAQMMGY